MLFLLAFDRWLYNNNVNVNKIVTGYSEWEIFMTILEVAQKAGVSGMTVSRVIRGKNSVSQATRKRVLQVMQELNYVPSLAARAMRSKDKLRSTGCLCCALVIGADVQSADSFFCDVVRSAEKEAAAHGLCLLQSHWQDSFEESWPRMQSLFSVGGLCGVVLAGQFSGEEVQAIQKQVGHVMILDGPAPDDTIVASVEADYANGCRLAIEHLHDRGAKRILVLTGADDHYFSRAMISAAESTGSPFEHVQVVNSDLTSAMGHAIIRNAFQDGLAFDGVFGNDELAIGALRAFSELGISVPQDVKVVGFDDITHSAFTSPPLTTVRIDKTQLGREAIRTLVQIIQGQDDLTQIKKIAKATLKMSDAGARIMGGMTKEEAREFLGEKESNRIENE